MHCRAGLGRTGTLIGLWLMRRAGFTARDAIAWLRIVRPGSVVGQQQQYLCARERRGWEDIDGLLSLAQRAPTKDRAASDAQKEGDAPGAVTAPTPGRAGQATATAAGAAAAAELAVQVTAAMCARGAARAEAARCGHRPA